MSKERKWINLIPSFFRDKAEGNDLRETDELPEDLREKFINGTEQEALQALEEIRTRERLQKIILLSEAGEELLMDFRAMAQAKKK